MILLLAVAVAVVVLVVLVAAGVMLAGWRREREVPPVAFIDSRRSRA